MTFHQLTRVTSMRLEELQKERWAIAQARWAGRPHLARSLAKGLRRVADALDEEPTPSYAAAR
ncbi:MAG TPA: hypothetical protein VF202_05220 [Trueperaceae bacterium]|jgi:hypothetical protein